MTTANCPDNPLFDEASFVVVTSHAPGDEVSDGDTVEGCSRTFESNIHYTLTAANGDVLDEGNTMGGGVDGPGDFEFDLSYDVSQDTLAYLEVGDADASGGASGNAENWNRIPLVLTGN